MDGQSQLDVRRRIQAGANAWRKADGHTSDRRNYKTKLKRESMCHIGMSTWCRYNGTDRATTTGSESL